MSLLCSSPLADVSTPLFLGSRLGRLAHSSRSSRQSSHLLAGPSLTSRLSRLQKICPAFTKEAGKPEARLWLEIFGYAPLARLHKMVPDVDWSLDDVIAMFMFCGYESVVRPIL